MSEDYVKNDRDPLNAWMRSVDNWMKADTADPTLPPAAPVDALITLTDVAFGRGDAYVLALATELRQTRAERDAARQELAAARAARDAALDALEGMVRQHCGPMDVTDRSANVSGRGLHANADAIVLLADAGRIVIEGGEGGRTVYGRWVR